MSLVRIPLLYILCSTFKNIIINKKQIHLFRNVVTTSYLNNAIVNKLSFYKCHLLWRLGNEALFGRNSTTCKESEWFVGIQLLTVKIYVLYIFFYSPFFSWYSEDRQSPQNGKLVFLKILRGLTQLAEKNLRGYVNNRRIC